MFNPAIIGGPQIYIQWKRIFSFALLISILFVGTMTASDGQPDFDSYIWGRVIDIETGAPLANFTVVFNASYFDTMEVRTSNNGSYIAYLPPKDFTISVYNEKGELVDRTTDPVSLGIEDRKWMDFKVEPDKPLKAIIFGTILGKDSDPLKDATVRLKNKDDHSKINISITDEDGKFSLKVEPGDYLLEVMYEDEIYLESNHTFDLDLVYDLELKVDAEEEKTVLTLDDVTKFLEDHWLDILILLLLIFIIVMAYVIILTILNFFRKKKVEFLESDWFIISRRFLTRMAVLGIILILARQISIMFPSIDEYLWEWMRQAAAPAAGIILIISISRLILLGNTSLWDWLKSRRRSKGKQTPQQFISLFSLVIRYLIIVLAIAVVIILVLIAVGLRERIWEVLGDFLSDNASKLGFLVVLVIAAVLLKKFIDIFFKELGTRSTKLNPQIMSMSQKGTTGMMYFIITLIFLYTLLSIGGLGDIGTTFILVISMIIGLVVSFAATGSIGNMLSGLVLMSMKPYEIGDRVMIGDMIGFVQKIGIMFTTMKDLEDRIIEVPNNNILSNEIMNFTRSAKEGGFAVVVDVGLGYDISPKSVRPLLKRAAQTSPGVLKDPTPRVIVQEFQDHAVVYRLRAYVDNPQNMLFIRSSVMESILMIFHEEGLEVMSPLQHVKVEGERPTKEDLMMRAHPEVNNNEPDATGLTMFDTLEKSG
jgi:small-conductance mechanosensitive channel